MKLRNWVVHVSKLFQCALRYALPDRTLIGCPDRKNGRKPGPASGATGKDMAAGFVSFYLR